nr:hypothetical protein [Tanacetum cinerariifolium]
MPIEVVTQTSSVKISAPVKENIGAPLIEDWESDEEDEVESPPEKERKNVKPSVNKVEVEIPKQNDKPARRLVKYDEMYKTQRPRGNQRNWNNLKSHQLSSNSVMSNKACHVCGSFNHLQARCKYHQRERTVNGTNHSRVNHNATIVPKAMFTRTGLKLVNSVRLVNPKRNFFKKINTANEKVNTARPNSAVLNAVRANKGKAVKASACWVWRPIKLDSVSIILKKQIYIDARGRSKSVMAWIPKEPNVLISCAGSFTQAHRRSRYFNSGCSSYMTGNISYLTDFKEFDEGYVVFGGGAKGGKITGKGTIRSGIKREYIVARTPQQNGVAERRNITLIETPRTMLADSNSKLPITCWAEAFNTACYVQNRVLVVKPHFKTPYELFRGRTPALSFMRPFGCHVTILNTLNHLVKNGKSDKGFFVGYSTNSKAFRVYNTRTRKVEENLRIKFLENKSLIADSDGENPDTDGSSTKSKIDNQETPNDENSTEDINTIGPSINTASLNINNASPTVNTVRLSNDYFGASNDMRSLDGVELDISNLSTTYPILTTLNTIINKDHSLDNVIGDMQNQKYYQCTKRSIMVEVMQEELLQFHLQKVWTLVDLPRGKRAIGTKWVFQNKKNERGIVIKKQSQISCPVGCTQEEGIDYDEFFAPVARIEAIRLFLAYASFMGFLVYQMDVKSAFLYGRIEEEVYVCQPPGFEDPDYPDKVYKVEKALYGLPQAPRACQNKYVDEILRKFKYEDVKPSSTPMDKENDLLKDSDGDDVDVHLYSKKIFRYLKGHPKLGLWYPKGSSFNLVAYTDSDYAGASLDRKSTSRGSASCCGQVLWIQNQLLDYRCLPSHVDEFDIGQEDDQFWRTASVKTLNNGEIELNATVDGQVKTITEASVRTHLKLVDADDEGITKEMHDGMGRANTTASSLAVEQGSGTITKTQTKITPSGLSSPRTSSEGGFECHFTIGDSPIQARPERLSNLPNEPPLREEKVTSLENKLTSTKAVYNKALITLTKRIKKLEKQLKHKGRRAVIDSSDDAEPSLDAENSPKQRRMIEEFDKDGIVNLVQSSEQGEAQDTSKHRMEFSIASPQTADNETFTETLLNIKRSAAKDKGKGIMQEP